MLISASATDWNLKRIDCSTSSSTERTQPLDPQLSSNWSSWRSTSTLCVQVFNLENFYVIFKWFNKSGMQILKTPYIAILEPMKKRNARWNETCRFPYGTYQRYTNGKLLLHNLTPVGLSRCTCSGTKKKHFQIFLVCVGERLVRYCWFSNQSQAISFDKTCTKSFVFFGVLDFTLFWIGFHYL